MTRKQRIRAAIAFTESQGGLEAFYNRTTLKLGDGYIVASADGLKDKGIHHEISPRKSKQKVHVWGIDKDGIATTEFR